MHGFRLLIWYNNHSMNQKELPSGNFSPKKIFLQTETACGRDIYVVGAAAKYNIRHGEKTDEQWTDATHTIQRIKFLRNNRPNLPINLAMEEIYNQSYQLVNIKDENLLQGNRGEIKNPDQLDQLPGVNRNTRIFTFDADLNNYVDIKINSHLLLKDSIPERDIEKIFISTGYEEQFVNVQRSNGDRDCFIFIKDQNEWQPVQINDKVVNLGFFQYDEKGNEVLCIFTKTNENQWQYYAKPRRLPLAQAAYTPKEEELIQETFGVMKSGFGQNNRQFEQDLTEILLLSQNNQLPRQIRELVRKQIMSEVRNACIHKTSKFLQILSNYVQSDLILSAVNLDCVMRSILGEQIEENFVHGSIADLTSWINDLSQMNLKKLSIIIHKLGGNEENLRIQAFFLKMFVLFSQPNLKIPENNNPSPRVLTETAKTIMSVLTEKPTDVGNQFKSYIDQIGGAIGKSNYEKYGQGLYFGNEGEQYFQHNKLEFQGAPNNNLGAAFAVPDTMLNLNLALKKDKLLFALTGDSLHTHVGFPDFLKDYPELKSLLEKHFLSLDIGIYFCVNPVDRLFYMLQNRGGLAIFDDMPDNKGLKKQSRLGMTLDELSHQIAKSEAFFSHQIAQLVRIKHYQTAIKYLTRTQKNIAFSINDYLNSQIKTIDDCEEKKLLEQVINLYNQYLFEPNTMPSQLKNSVLIWPLLTKLNKLIVEEKSLEKNLIRLRKRQEKYGDVSYEELNQAKENLEAARMVPIDNFFLVGKENRDRIGEKIVDILDAASSEIAESLNRR